MSGRQRRNNATVAKALAKDGIKHKYVEDLDSFRWVCKACDESFSTVREAQRHAVTREHHRKSDAMKAGEQPPPPPVPGPGGVGDASGVIANEAIDAEDGRADSAGEARDGTRGAAGDDGDLGAAGAVDEGPLSSQETDGGAPTPDRAAAAFPANGVPHANPSVPRPQPPLPRQNLDEAATALQRGVQQVLHANTVESPVSAHDEEPDGEALPDGLHLLLGASDVDSDGEELRWEEFDDAPIGSPAGRHAVDDTDSSSDDVSFDAHAPELPNAAGHGHDARVERGGGAADEGPAGAADEAGDRLAANDSDDGAAGSREDAEIEPAENINDPVGEGNSEGSANDDPVEAAADAEPLGRPAPARRDKPPKKGTAAWYRSKRFDPILEDHDWSLLQICYWLARLKSEYRVTDIALDMFCSFVHFLLLPAGNIFPPSYYLVKAVLGVPDGVACVRHVCDNCWQLFPELEPDLYRENCNEQCVNCGRRRFNVGVNGKPRPKRCVYYFGEEAIMTDLLTKPGVLDEIIDTRAKAWDEPWTFWGSPAGRDLDKRCNYKFSQPADGEIAVLFSLGGDGAQLFDTKQHGALIWGLKLQDRDPALAAKNDAWAPVGLAEGPTEPSDVTSIFESLFDCFWKHDPGREGSTPLEVVLGDGSIIKVWPVLGFVEGDIPWLAKLMKSVGHAGKHACYRCGLNGIYHPSAKAVRWLGYANDIQQRVPCFEDGETLHQADAVDHSGDAPRMPAGYQEHDKGAYGVRSAWTAATVVTSVLTWITCCVFKYSGLEMLARGWAAENIKKQVFTCTVLMGPAGHVRMVNDPDRAPFVGKQPKARARLAEEQLKALGVRGRALFSDLSYFNPCHFFRLGAAHILLLGILADFWAQWIPTAAAKKKASSNPNSPVSMYVLPPKVRKHIQGHAQYVMLTELFGKPYRDITKYRGSWLMEDWMSFLEAFSLFLLHELPWSDGDDDDDEDDDEVREVFEEMWGNLREGLMYFLKYEEGQHTEDQILNAQKALLAYGKQAEEVFGGQVICTFKLHLAAVHLADQVRVCGASFFCLEYWVERMVQLFKRMIKYRSTAYPELLFIHDYLLIRTCMLLLRCGDGEELISLEDALKQERRLRSRRPERAADARADDDVFCGAPRLLSDEERAIVLPAWPWPERTELGGLPYLLYSERDMHERGWPTARLFPDGRYRQGHITRSLGMDADGIDKDAGVEIKLQKFVRADLPVGDAVSSAQCKTQHRKDNSWCLVEYETAEDQIVHYIGQIDFFVRADYTTEDGFNRVPACRHPAETLDLAVVTLYECETELETPGLRKPNPAVKRPPEFIKMPDVGQNGRHAVFASAGQWVVNLTALTGQVVPTGCTEDGKFFMWANKSSGKTAPVKLH